ncbi:hypothetical protein MTO96_004910 [Rhipicephalus appendiculatus]
MECGLTQGDDEDVHPAPSASVALVSGTTPGCVSERQSDRDDCVQDAAPTERKKLQLKPRSVPVEVNRKGAAVLAPRTSSSIFGGARPVDTAAREREIEARLARQREEEARRRIRHREPFQDSRKDDWVRRSSVASVSGRPQRFSESGRDYYDDGGRQPSSQQCSNDSRHRSQSGSHGSQARCEATVRDEPGDSPKTPPADRIRRPDFEVKVTSAPPSTDTATKSCQKRMAPEHLPRIPSDIIGNHPAQAALQWLLRPVAMLMHSKASQKEQLFLHAEPGSRFLLKHACSKCHYLHQKWVGLNTTITKVVALEHSRLRSGADLFVTD